MSTSSLGPMLKAHQVVPWLPSRSHTTAHWLNSVFLEEDPTGVESFVHGAHPSLPDEIFAFALADYWERTRPHLWTLSLEDVLYSPGSPGAAFKLTENALVERLERLPEWTGLRFDETAGRRLLLRTNNTSGEGVDSSLTILRTYYEDEGEE